MFLARCVHASSPWINALEFLWGLTSSDRLIAVVFDRREVKKARNGWESGASSRGLEIAQGNSWSGMAPRVASCAPHRIHLPSLLALCGRLPGAGLWC